MNTAFPQHQGHPEAVGDRSYVRFAALGDSASCGVGDPTPSGWRGWAQILADAMGADHDVSFLKLATPGAVVADVRQLQLSEAVDHRPVIASLVVGLNDTMRSTWDSEQMRADLLLCADELARQAALLITVRFHDHTRVLGLPSLLARPLRRRIEVLNDIYDEVHEKYGTLQLDLAADPAIYSRELWSADRLHPSELGHRRLARLVGQLLVDEGLVFELPSSTCTGARPTWHDTAHLLLVEVAPWIGRRIRDLVPSAAHKAVAHLRAGMPRSSR